MTEEKQQNNLDSVFEVLNHHYNLMWDMYYIYLTSFPTRHECDQRYRK